MAHSHKNHVQCINSYTDEMINGDEMFRDEKKSKIKII